PPRSRPFSHGLGLVARDRSPRLARPAARREARAGVRRRSLDMVSAESRGLPALELEGIRKQYGRNEALRRGALPLSPGRFYALVGSNGSGKSTLMRVIARREPPDAGTGRILGTPLDADVSAHGLRVAFVHEDLSYDVPLSIAAFFERYPRMHVGWDY